ncbi:TetR family transcriptional regulator [Lentzea cavernae]|uniref:TetR family transcriptional regulator n=1 Tax=Lentzea cavernae TaxID=2020703 RepID=A0ABQ3MGE1_9PSEU|nr:TetR family transcriptional regulator [Lentzea cavernae]
MVAADPLLAAGFDAFARHGFKRATMADIAAGAGMSRPALYLRVKGKEDVLRAVGAALLAESIVRARTAADETGDISARVVAVLEAKLGLTLGLAERSEHALELLVEYGRVATAEAAQYTAEVEQLTARVLATSGADAGRCADIATALVRTVQGLETELDDAPRARKLLAALVGTTVAGLTRS